MSNKKSERVMVFDCRTPETMTAEERDADYLSRFGMTYDEFNEYYKDDTPESLQKEFREFLNRCAI